MNTEQEFREVYLKDIEVKNGLMVDLNGRVFTAEEYLHGHYLGMEAQYNKGVIPRAYEYPTGAQLELTYKCNQRCRHCYNQSGEENNENTTGLSVDEWKEIAKQLGELGIFQCVISGGEPTLLGDKLFEIMDVLHDYGIRFIFITNGMLLSDEKIERLKKYRYNWMQVSIDGSRPELHNYVRGMDSWEKALKAANRVKKAGMPLVIAHAVVKKNLDYLGEMIDMAYLMGARRIITGPFSYMGRAVLNSDELILSEEDKKQIYEICNQKSMEYNGRMEVAVTAEEVVSMRMRLCDPNGVVLIRPNGDVKIDCVAPFKIGNVREQSIKEIWGDLGKDVWHHPRVKEYISQIKSSEDLLTVKPRINVDPDEQLKVLKEEELKNA